MKSVIYARKSSESVDRQVQSIDDQIAALTAAAKRNGDVINEILSEARSAKDPWTRPVFSALVSEIEKGRIGGIYVWAMNRLARNQEEGGKVGHLLQTGKIPWIKTNERIYFPEDSALMMAIEFGMATSFIQDLRRNVIRGLDSKASKGWAPWRPGIGYVNDLATKEIVPDPERYDLIRKGWELLLAGGHTVTEIDQQLFELGLTNRYSKCERVSRNTLYYAFSNPFYKGELHYRGKVYVGSHKPMVTSEEFQAAQRILGRAPDLRYRKHEFTYSGILKCGICGCSVVAETKVKRLASGDTRSYTYYHCTNGKGICDKQSVSEGKLKEDIDHAMDKVRLAPAVAEWATMELLALSDKELNLADNSMESLVRKEERAGARMTRLHEMRIDGEVSAEEYKQLKDSIQNEQNRLKATSRRVATREERLRTYVEEKLRAAMFDGAFTSLIKAEQRAKLLAMGAGHSLTRGKVQIRVHPLLQEIAAFEPPATGSGSSKGGDCIQHDLSWQARWDRIRKIALAEMLLECDKTPSGLIGLERMLP